MKQFQRQAAGLLLIVVGAAALYWARPEWLVWSLLALVGFGMLISIPGEGRQ